MWLKDYSKGGARDEDRDEREVPDSPGRQKLRGSSNLRRLTPLPASITE